MLKQAIVKHTSTFVHSRKPLNKKQKSDNRDLLKFVVLEMKQRFEIRFSTFFVLASSIIPARCRSNRTNRVLALANQSMKKVEESLDVKRIIDTQDDLKNLLKNLFDSQQMWLFKR